MVPKSEKQIRKMAELLKTGATLLNETCPECNSLLFQDGDRIFCPTCNRRVVIVKDQEEITQFYRDNIIADGFEALSLKLRDVIPEITKDKNHDRLDLLTYLKELLECMRLLNSLSDKTT